MISRICQAGGDRLHSAFPPRFSWPRRPKMLRARFSESLKAAMKAHDARTVSTLRMVMSGLKNRDIAARDKGNMTGIDDAEISQMLQGMVKQRRESMALYEQGKRPE